MNASQLKTMLQFTNTHPRLYLRDMGKYAGSIRVLAKDGEWLATIIPDFSPEGNVLLFRNPSGDEFRGGWGLIATVLSVYQQTGGDWAQVYDAEEQALEWE